MPPKSKSIFRQPGVQHFQLVHRSQRDPLINDPSASKHVLKGFERSNVTRKGKSRAELESILGEEATHERANVGEAALYEIYFDDTEYDYMQHLRPIGSAEEGVIDSVLLEAPAASHTKSKGKGKAGDLELRLPADALPSQKLMSQQEAQDSLLSVPQALTGFQPDMDPHLRQTLEALEDDAFVMPDAEEEGEDGEDFFGELLGGGEVEDGEEREEYEFEEWGMDEHGQSLEPGPHAQEGEEVDDLTRRVKAFKLAQARGKDEPEGGSEEEGSNEEVEEIELSESEVDALRARLSAFQLTHKGPASDAWSDTEKDDFRSEAGSTLPPLPVIGGKRRRKGAYSDASGFSMSSSSVWRSRGQQLVDDRFDVVEKAYEEGASDEERENEEEEEEEDGPPTLVNSRSDFEAVIDGFMQQYEQVGNHVRPASEKLDTLRRALAQDLRLTDRMVRSGGDTDEEILMPVDVDEVKDTWDVETILSTYSNLDNHPRVISARASTGSGVKRIRLDTRTGLPTVNEEGTVEPRSRRSAREDQPSSEKRQKLAPKVTVARPKDESKDEKKARKAAVKQERQERRVEKKATKTAFSTERKSQLRNAPALSVSAVAMKL